MDEAERPIKKVLSCHFCLLCYFSLMHSRSKFERTIRACWRGGAGVDEQFFAVKISRGSKTLGWNWMKCPAAADECLGASHGIPPKALARNIEHLWVLR